MLPLVTFGYPRVIDSNSLSNVFLVDIPELLLKYYSAGCGPDEIPGYFRRSEVACNFNRFTACCAALD